MFGLSVFVVIMAILVFTGFMNEKVFKLPTEITLLIASFLMGVGYILVSLILDPSATPKGFPIEYLSDFLVNGVLCFMLFSGSCGITFKKLKKNIRPITLLAILTTTISTLVFGLLLYGILYLVGFTTFSIIECLLLGAIVSPTDPIAATSILKKFGLSEDLILTIEGESLFNDGVGIAIFIAISGILKHSGQPFSPLSFFEVMGKEIFGAIILAIIVCYIMFFLFKSTKDKLRQIFISIFTVSLVYVLCQYLGFSSAIASVVCGIYFATFTEKHDKGSNSYALYYDFWEILDTLLNSILYIILGFFFLNVFLYASNNVLVIVSAIASVLVSRYLGVFLVSLLLKRIPEDLSRSKFSGLLTWAGLKGGLSLALMIEASDLLAADTFNAMIISVFAIVMFTTTLQGLTVEKFYKKIRK